MTRSEDNRVGVALTKCYFCNKDDCIVINTKLTINAAKAVEAAHGKIINMEPCPNCASMMKRGIILITIDDARSDKGWSKQQLPNPFRTGGWFVVSEDAVQRIFTGDAQAFALEHRWCFIDDAAARQLGLFTTTPSGDAGDQHG